MMYHCCISLMYVLKLYSLQVFELHAHEESSGDHAHGHGEGEEEEGSQEYIWRACVILLGVYVFFLLELFLHSLSDRLTKSVRNTYMHTHTHTHAHPHPHTLQM